MPDSIAISLAHGDFDKAISALKSIIKLHKDSSDAYRFLAIAYYKAHKYDDAVDAYLDAAKIDKCDSCYSDFEAAGTISLKENNPDHARKYLMVALKRGSESAGGKIAATYLIEGDKHINELHLSSAVDAFTEGLKYQKDTLLYQRLVYTYWREGENDVVLRLSDTLISQYPDFQFPRVISAALFLSRGQKLAVEKKLHEAIAMLTTSIERSTQNPDAYFERGYCYEQLHDSEKTLENYESVIKLGTKNYQAFYDIGRYYTSMGRLPQALKLVQESLQLRFMNVDAWKLLSQIYTKMNDSDNSVKSYKVAADLGCDDCKKELENKYPNLEFAKHDFKMTLEEHPWLLKDDELDRADTLIRVGLARSPKDSASNPGEFVPVDKAPIPVYQTNPDYPETARRLGIEGTVWVKMLVNKLGVVTKAIVMKSDQPLFNEVSMSAALQWVFTPAILKGEPVAVWAAVPFRFRLNK